MPKQDFYEIDKRMRARAEAELAPEILKAIHDDVAERGAIIDLAIAVRKARKKAGLTQAALAELTGVTQAQLSRIERGEFAPRIETLAKIAVALKTQFVIGPESSSASPSAA